ncbi:hypothetical protein BDZ91DRAFT_791415 [Kalaharituber pfeilii]|nr:hypothetical protein BDZ91DRAFT_791415 [Kalaharituber pfeilii]
MSYPHPSAGHNPQLSEDQGPLLTHTITGASDVISQAIDRDFQRRYGRSSHPPQWSAQTESQDLQTRYNPLQSSDRTHLARKHSSKHQLFHLLEKVVVRLIWSILLSAAMIGCFKYFEKVKVLNDLEKNVFNVLSTMIYLTMGLNLASAFKGMATMLRWKLLARKPHNLKEIDLILGISSLIKVGRLGFNALGFGKPFVFISCLLWILLNCVARVSVAFTGLTYSYDSANATGTELGVVLVSEKSRFWPLGRFQEEPPETGAEFQTAHFFGEYSAMMADNMADNPHDQQMLRYDKSTKSWVYEFREWNPKHPAYMAVTNRTIKVTATCNAYDIVKGQNGLEPNIIYYNSTDGENWVISEVSVRGPGATVWANPRADINPEPQWTCALGNRCAIVAGFQFIDTERKEEVNGTLFQCAVLVGEVENARVPEHEIDDRVAFIAAGAIGLNGFSDDPQDWLYQRYFRGTRFGQRFDGDPDQMAMLVSRFSVGVIATMDMDNPKIEAVGMKPWVGVLFKVDWALLLTILGSICGIQLVLGLTAVFVSNTVIVKDDSYLSTARLLRPLVERLGPSGCALTGKEIATTLRTTMVYGVRVDKSRSRHHLDIGEDIIPGQKFPNGWYDGDVEGMVPYTDEPTPEEEKRRLLARIEEEEDLLHLA